MVIAQNLVDFVSLHRHEFFGVQAQSKKSRDVSPRRSPRAQSFRALQSTLGVSNASAFSVHSAVKFGGIPPFGEMGNKAQMMSHRCNIFHSQQSSIFQFYITS